MVTSPCGYVQTVDQTEERAPVDVSLTGRVTTQSRKKFPQRVIPAPKRRELHTLWN
jgi:hypothetical protein